MAVNPQEDLSNLPSVSHFEGGGCFLSEKGCRQKLFSIILFSVARVRLTRAPLHLTNSIQGALYRKLCAFCS